MTKSGSVNTDVIGRKEYVLHTTIKGILVRATDMSSIHPKKVSHPKSASSTFLQNIITNLYSTM